MEFLFTYLPTNIIELSLLALIYVSVLWLLFKAKKSQYIIYGLLIWLPLETLILKFVPDNMYAVFKYLPEITLYGAVVAGWLSYFHKSHWFFPKNPILKWVVLYIAIASVSLVLNQYSFVTWTLGLRQVLRFVMVFFLVVFMKYDREIVRNMLYIGAGVIGFEILLGFIQFASGGRLDKYLLQTGSVVVGSRAVVGGVEQFWTPGTRIFGSMGRYDRLGSLLSLGLILLYPWNYFIKIREKRMIFWSVFIIGCTALLLTLSRASWIALAIGIFIIGYVIMRDKKVLKAFGLLFAVITVYLFIFVSVSSNVMNITEKPTQSLGERIVEAVSQKSWHESYDGAGRIFFIINTPKKVISSAPLFGVGPGNFGGGTAAALSNTIVYDKFSMPFGIQNTYGQIDNSLLSIWAEMGTFGFLTWIAMFGALVSAGLYVYRKNHGRMERVLALGLCGLAPAMLVIAFFGPYLEFRTLMFYFWLTAGVVGLYWYKEKERGNFVSS